MGVVASLCAPKGDKADHVAPTRLQKVQSEVTHPEWIDQELKNQATLFTHPMMNNFRNEKIYSSAEHYENVRKSIIDKEAELAFDHHVHAHATLLEERATRIIRAIRRDDVENVYKVETDNLGQHRLPAGHFLGNVNMINKTKLFEIAQRFPKGAHLHCHFNSCLPPAFLIQHARGVNTMWIKSSCSLSTIEGQRKAEIQFQVQDPPEQRGNLLDPKYTPSDWMLYSDFRNVFGGDLITEKWLESKMLLNEDEVYGIPQTVINIWLRFDICTRMMKGLFGYESAFRAYTKACIEDFVKDGIQYAEIRPNFPSNVLRRDNGHDTIDNRGMMRIIVEEVKRQISSKPRCYFGGLKVIYCCPRSFSNKRIKDSMVECIALKKEFPDLICGYDLVGSEDRGRPLRDFVNEFLWFQAECKTQNLSIPFLFHAGETLDTGTSTDLNLLDAVMLNSKRIGHGFALTRHPEILQMVKDNNICLELCPISNEILHLTPTVKGHAFPDLLARGVHCTVNSDNGTFYSSTLSHDFYQVMIGSNSMDALGWKQLALWSIEHSCMEEAQMAEVRQAWEREWNGFCRDVVSTYGQQYDTE